MNSSKLCTKIKLICDSSIDLNDDIIKKEDIEILHFNVTVGNNNYQDGIDINSDNLFEIIKENNTLPKTSAFGPKAYDDVFNKFCKDYDDIIFIGLGSGFSSTLNCARMSASNYDNVHIIDSENLSSGTGLLVLKICKMRKNGYSAKDIVLEINKLVPLVRSQFTINTLEYLYKGGRCSGVSKIIGSLLIIKPIIRVVNNSMVVAKKPIGYNKALNTLIDECISLKNNIDLDCIMITHCKADLASKYIHEALSKYFDSSILLPTKAGTTVSSHCGEGTIGILYILKK